MFWFYFCMSNSLQNLNAFKQPAPTIVSSNSNGAKSEFKYPNVGVVNPPTISKTPLADTLYLNKKENPQTAYKLTQQGKKYQNGFKFSSFSSIVILICGTIAFLSGKKKTPTP